MNVYDSGSIKNRDMSQPAGSAYRVYCREYGAIVRLPCSYVQRRAWQAEPSSAVLLKCYREERS